MYGEKNVIGKKVNLLNKVDYSKYEMTMSEETYEVVRVIEWSPELNDYCQHYIVRGADGTEKEIRETECVFSPNTEKPTDYMIHDFLNDNGVWAEVYPYRHDIPVLVVDIHWGDWKHEHLWAKSLMSYLGYGEIGCKVTEEDGSDCYSAEHYFLKTA